MNTKVPAPYLGKEKYIFVSYAHKDSDRVFPVLSRLSELGYRIWFDLGIDPGTEWDENIAHHIDACEYYLAFVSKSFIDSENCKDELVYARDLSKNRLIVYLEEVDLPSGIAMRVNRIQSVFRYKYSDEKDFIDSICTSKGIALCRADIKLADTMTDSRIRKPRISFWLSFAFFILAVTFVCALAVALIGESSAFASFFAMEERPFRVMLSALSIASSAFAVVFAVIARYGLEKKSAKVLVNIFIYLPLGLGLLPIALVGGLAALIIGALFVVPFAIWLFLDDGKSAGKIKESFKKKK